MKCENRKLAVGKTILLLIVVGSIFIAFIANLIHTSKTYTVHSDYAQCIGVADVEALLYILDDYGYKNVISSSCPSSFYFCNKESACLSRSNDVVREGNILFVYFSARKETALKVEMEGQCEVRSAALCDLKTNGCVEVDTRKAHFQLEQNTAQH